MAGEKQDTGGLERKLSKSTSRMMEEYNFSSKIVAYVINNLTEITIIKDKDSHYILKGTFEKVKDFPNVLEEFYSVSVKTSKCDSGPFEIEIKLDL